MGFINKLKWVLSFLLIFFLVLATNLIDKNNFRKIKSSIVTIYEDRIVANDLIFEYLQLTHEKEMAVAVSDDDFFKERNPQVNVQLESLTTRYRTTKLTSREAIVFGGLQEDLSQLVAMEELMPITNSNNAYHLLLADIKQSLHKLSKIQLEEGRNQMAMSKNTVEEVESFTRIENYLLIFLAILIPVIIFGSTRSLKQIFG